MKVDSVQVLRTLVDLVHLVLFRTNNFPWMLNKLKPSSYDPLVTPLINKDKDSLFIVAKPPSQII